MGFRTWASDDLLFVRWLIPRPEDAVTLLETIRAQSSACGRRLVCVIVIYNDSPPPDPTTRAALRAEMPEALSMCRVVRYVMTGSSVRHALLRSMVAGFMLALRIGDREHAVVRSIGEALEQLRSELGGRDLAALRAELELELSPWDPATEA